MNNRNMNMEEIKPLTMPGVHSRFLDYFKAKEESENQTVLDLGAGHGAMTQKLYNMGYDVHACDLFPEAFEFSKVECRKMDISDPFPYPDQMFDLVIAIEVTEHILDHENFFREINRILKPGGRLYISTPNILSMKSRLQFLYRGFFYSFKPLILENYDGLQHISSITPDQYNYFAVKYGFGTAEVNTDRDQSTSRWLYFLFFPVLWLNQKIKGFEPIHNHKKLLLGRLLFMRFQKP